MVRLVVDGDPQAFQFAGVSLQHDKDYAIYLLQNLGTLEKRWGLDCCLRKVFDGDKELEFLRMYGFKTPSSISPKNIYFHFV